MAKENLGNARKARNDEFYTQYAVIEKEINAYLDFNPNVFRDKTVLLPCDDPEWSNFTKYFAQNFEKLGLKKLISTSYAPNSKNLDDLFAPTLFEEESEKYDKNKSEINGRIFTLTRDLNKDSRIDVRDLEWDYLEGDGDFRSSELEEILAQVDFVITNPPFSLFREFIVWIMASRKKFAIIGNMNAITYKEVFPLIQHNEIWLGSTNFNTGMYFRVPESFQYAPTYKFEREQNGEKVNRVPGVCWYTNIEHGRRHLPLELMTMADQTRYSKHKEVKGIGFKKYDNFDAIEVPFTDSIPSDFKGIMGVPISFLDKYDPEQFEILDYPDGKVGPGQWIPIVENAPKYARILIRHRKPKA